MQVFVVDAFTDRAFAGNPAGVVLLEEPADESWMQQVAAEMRHAETAFVVVGGDDPLPLRWFTPVAEVDLCGHATLATAHVLGDDHSFATRSGVLACTTGNDGWIEMDFPADPPEPVELGDDLRAALRGVEVVDAADGVSDLLVQAGDAAQVRALRPDLDAIARHGSRGVIVTALGDRPGVDVVSRCFLPGIGIPEDPVTGSAHCTLASWWAPRLGRAELVGEQASPRGGVVRMVLDGERVRLAGRAVTVLAGELRV